jgi:hypothetical protein
VQSNLVTKCFFNLSQLKPGKSTYCLLAGKTINPKKRTGENIMSELMVFHNKNENNDGSAYTLRYLTPVTFPISENGLNIVAKKASVNSIQVQPGGNTVMPPIPVNPQTFEITFQIELLMPRQQPLPPIIIKGAGGSGLDQPGFPPPLLDEFGTEMKFNETDFPAITVKALNPPDSIEFLIQSSFEIYTGCTIFPEGKNGNESKSVNIPLAAGFIIICRQEL